MKEIDNPKKHDEPLNLLKIQYWKNIPILKKMLKE